MKGRSVRVCLLSSLFLAGCAGELESQPPPPPPPPSPAVAPSQAQAPPPAGGPVYTTSSPVAAQPAPQDQTQVGSPPPAPPNQVDANNPPPPAPAQAPPQAPQYAPSTGAEQAPPQSQWVYSSAEGQWVYTTDYGWIWVPRGAAASDMEGVPYAYLYTPAHGWTWYVSPWGRGVFRYGAWVRHPWRPVGWRGDWVAQPRVYVRLGRPRYYYRR
jgi:hypothetical protein